jgi:hypothetical protein
LLIDIYYYLDESSKHNLELKTCQLMCEIKAHKILKHVATRWLLLGKCLALSQPNDKQFFHGMSCFTNSLFIKLKMCSPVQLSLQLGIEMCEIKAHKILKHVATRWLSLGKCLDRLFEQWDALNIFFKQEFEIEKKNKEK